MLDAIIVRNAHSNGIMSWDELKRLVTSTQAEILVRSSGREFDVEPVRRLFAEVAAAGEIMRRLHGQEDKLAILDAAPGYEDPEEYWVARERLIEWLYDLAVARIAHYRLI